MVQAYNAALAEIQLLEVSFAMAIYVETASEINKLFCEVVIVLHMMRLFHYSRVKNRILLTLNDIAPQKTNFRTALNGVLAQEANLLTDNKSHLKYVRNLLILKLKIYFLHLKFANTPNPTPSYWLKTNNFVLVEPVKPRELML